MKTAKIVALCSLIIAFTVGVAFAIPIDLTTGVDASVTASDSSIWRMANNHPTGTGVYDPFLRLGGNGAPTETGLNTDAKHVTVYDDQGGGDQWVHSVKWGDVAIVTYNGKQYYDFTLDINEADNSQARYLSLDVFKLYAYSGVLGGSATSVSQLGTAVYNLSLSNPVGPSVLLDYHLVNKGSGGDDMEALIPVFAVDPNSFLYLYTEFGNYASYQEAVTKGKKITYNTVYPYGSDAGFEEWRVQPGTSKVPEPGMLLMFSTGLLGLGFFGRKKSNK